MIQKNTSIQFPAVISDSFNELMDFIQKQKEDKEIVIVSMKDNLPEELKSLTDDLHADYINPLSDSFVSDLADAVSHNKLRAAAGQADVLAKHQARRRQNLR